MKRPRPMPAGPGGKDVVVEFLARDSSHGPAEAGHVHGVNFAHGLDHEARIPRQSRKIKGCAEVDCILEASHPGAFVFDAVATSSQPQQRIGRAGRLDVARASRRLSTGNGWPTRGPSVRAPRPGTAFGTKSIEE